MSGRAVLARILIAQSIRISLVVVAGEGAHLGLRVV